MKNMAKGESRYNELINALKGESKAPKSPAKVIEMPGKVEPKLEN
jgi:hypothetical protein